jgi:hypothetical protein
MAVLMFWNIGKRDNSTAIGQLCREHDVDVLLLAEALVHGSGEELAWSLSMRRSDSTNGYWLCDTDHAVEDMDGDSDFAALSVV